MGKPYERNQRYDPSVSTSLVIRRVTGPGLFTSSRSVCGLRLIVEPPMAPLASCRLLTTPISLPDSPNVFCLQIRSESHPALGAFNMLP